jgi:hypothetical protein
MKLDDDDAPSWTLVFTAESTIADLEWEIGCWTRRSVEALREQLAADAAFTDRERAALVARATPLIERETRASLERAYRRLQPTPREFTNVTDRTVH